MTPQDIINQYKSSNPLPPTPTTGGSDWYSQVKQGAYRPAGVQTPQPQEGNAISNFGNTLMGNTTPNQGAMFSTNQAQASQPGTGIGIATKTAANVLPDFVRTTLGFPVAVAGQAIDVAKNVAGLFKESAPINNLSPEANARAQAKGLPTNQGGNTLVNTITNYIQGVADPSTLVGTLKGIVPSAAQKIVKGDFTGAAQDIANHPFQQIAPFLMTLEQGAKGLGKGEAFDTAISKTAAPVIKAGEIASRPIVAATSGASKLAGVLAKYGTSQATGLSPDTVSRIISNPQDFSPEAMKGFTREGVANQALADLNTRINDLSDTGKEYKGVRESKTPVTIPDVAIKTVLKTHGIETGKSGKLIFNKESTPTSAGDRAALQDWYNTYGKDTEHTSNSFLNARKGLDNLAQWDSTKTDAANKIAMDIRRTLNRYGKPQVPGLNELDTRFSSEVAELKQVKKDYFNSDGTLKDNAISKIANLSNKGRENVLNRLEQVSPGIGEKVRTLKAVEDIQAAGGQKVGAYARAIVPGAAGYFAGGPVGAIVSAILSSPTIATQILRGYGKMLGIKDTTMTKIIGDYEKNAPITPPKNTPTQENIKIDNNSNIPNPTIPPPNSQGLKGVGETPKLQNETTNTTNSSPDLTKSSATLDSLTQEARKYKSAEEFVKAQTTLYHSGTADIKAVDMGKTKFSKTFYLSDNADYAKSFGGKDSVVNEMTLDPKANIIDLRKPNETQIKAIVDRINIYKGKPAKYGESFSFYPYSEKQVIQGIRDGKAHFAELPQVKQILKDLGYDGQITSEVPYAKNIGIWNKDVIKTKSQLTDIWNTANKGTDPLIDQATKGTTQTSSLGEKIKATGEQKPTIQLKRDVTITTLSGEKVTIPESEVLKAYESGGKALLKDGREYVVSKSQYENIKNNSLKSEAKPFAPELQGTEETVKGAKAGLTDLRIIPSENKGWFDIVDSRGDLVDRAENMTDAKKALKMNTTPPPDTKYSQYQLPGGKNYKEVLIKAPDPMRAEMKAQEANNSFENIPVGKYPATFKSSHWDEPNVISHLRLNERTYQGKKVTFMEELQSDWARELRKQGEQAGTPYTVENIGAGGRVMNTENKVSGAVPNNPLLKNWQELSVKRALKEAVDNNSEYLSWTTGEQQAARYDLSKQVSRVSYTEKGSLDAWDLQGKPVITKSNVKPDELAGIIGKEPARKLLETKPITEGHRTFREIKGEQLSVGGEWAKNLYDKQVKNIVEDITGHKVEVIDMGLDVSEPKSIFTIERNGLTDNLRASDLKVGAKINEGGNTDYIITDVLGDGKFKAVPKSAYDNLRPETRKNLSKLLKEGTEGNQLDIARLQETFDISTKKSAGQQAIRLTDDIKRMVRGEKPKLK